MAGSDSLKLKCGKQDSSHSQLDRDGKPTFKLFVDVWTKKHRCLYTEKCHWHQSNNMMTGIWLHIIIKSPIKYLAYY